jgi:outer membrane protein
VNKLHNIATLLLLIGMSTLFVLHFKNKPQETEKPQENKKPKKELLLSADSLALGNLKIAYINTDSLWDKYEQVKEMKKVLESEKTTLESQFKRKLKALEKEFIDFQENAQFMSREQGERKQAELMQKEKEFYKMEEDISLQLMESEKSKNEIIIAKISDYLERYNEDNDYDFILGYNLNLMGNVLYAKKSFDITQEIVDGLNEEYDSAKTKTKK